MDMDIDMRIDMYMDLCVEIHVGTCIDMGVDMGGENCKDMRVDIVQTCAQPYILAWVRFRLADMRTDICNVSISRRWMDRGMRMGTTSVCVERGMHARKRTGVCTDVRRDTCTDVRTDRAA